MPQHYNIIICLYGHVCFYCLLYVIHCFQCSACFTLLLIVVFICLCFYFLGFVLLLLFSLFLYIIVADYGFYVLMFLFYAFYCFSASNMLFTTIADYLCFIVHVLMLLMSLSLTRQFSVLMLFSYYYSCFLMLLFNLLLM